jgi:hypothetical protein
MTRLKIVLPGKLSSPLPLPQRISVSITSILDSIVLVSCCYNVLMEVRRCHVDDFSLRLFCMVTSRQQEHGGSKKIRITFASYEVLIFLNGVVSSLRACVPACSPPTSPMM